MTNMFKKLMFHDVLNLPSVARHTLVDATRGGNVELEIIPAKFQPHSLIAPPQHNNCWTTVVAGTAMPGEQLDSYLGPVILANKNQPVTIKWHKTIINHEMLASPPIEIIGGTSAPDILNFQKINMFFRGAKTANGQDSAQTTANYQMTRNPNSQAANLLWYHDAASQHSEYSIYAGMLGFYVLRDAFDYALLQHIKPENEIPLILQDKQLWDPEANGGMGGLTAKMRYQTQAEIEDYSQAWLRAVPYSAWGQIPLFPEFYGEFNLVNGKLWPMLALPAQDIYRLRLLNACNSRTYALKFLLEIDSVWQFVNDWITIIGTDGGFLPEVQQLQSNEPVVLAPGERCDLLLDLCALKRLNLLADKAMIYCVNVAAVPFVSVNHSLASEQNSVDFHAPHSMLHRETTPVDAGYQSHIQGFPQVMCLEVDLKASVAEHPDFFETTLPAILTSARAEVAEFQYQDRVGWKPRQEYNFTANRVFSLEKQTRNICGILTDKKFSEIGLKCCQQIDDLYAADLLLHWDVATHQGDKCPPAARESTKLKAYQFASNENQADRKKFIPASYERWYFINLPPNSGPHSDPMGVLPNQDLRTLHLAQLQFYVGRTWSIAPDSQWVQLDVQHVRYSKLALRDTLQVAGNHIVELIVYIPSA